MPDPMSVISFSAFLVFTILMDAHYFMARDVGWGGANLMYSKRKKNACIEKQ